MISIKQSKRKKHSVYYYGGLLTIITFISVYLVITRQSEEQLYPSEEQLAEYKVIKKFVLGRRGCWKQSEEFIQELPSLLPFLNNDIKEKPLKSVEELPDYNFYRYDQILHKYNPEIFASFPSSVDEFEEKFHEELTKTRKIYDLSNYPRKTDRSLDWVKYWRNEEKKVIEKEKKKKEEEKTRTALTHNINLGSMRRMNSETKQIIEEVFGSQLQNHLNQFPSLVDKSELSQWTKQYIKIFLCGEKLCAARGVVNNEFTRKEGKKLAYGFDYRFQEIKSPWNEATMKFCAGFELKKEPKNIKHWQLNSHFV